MRTGTIEYAINLMNKDDTKLSAELLNVHTLYSKGGWVQGYENKMSILSEYRTRAYASTELSAVSFPCEDWASEFNDLSERLEPGSGGKHDSGSRDSGL